MDNLSPEIRKKNMRAIKSRETKIENKISKALWHEGYRFRKNSKKLLGKPDLSMIRYKIVIFIDSCFWHGCPLHSNVPKTNSDYWINKIARNKARDEYVSSHYRNSEWLIIRIWEHEIKENFNGVINKIIEALHTAKRSQKINL